MTSTDTDGSTAPADNTMDDYREIVERAAREADGQVILNRTVAHAAIVVSNIFGVASNIIEILTGCLDDEVWGNPEVIDAALAYFDRDATAKIRIVTEVKLDTDKNLFLAALRRAGRLAQIKLFTAHDGVTDRYGFHFIVADGAHYRFQKDRAKFEAMIQFNGTDTATKLRSIFAGIRARSDLVAV